MTETLQKLREEINLVDAELLAILSKRAEIVEDVVKEKIAMSVDNGTQPAVHDKQREKSVIAEIVSANESQFSDKEISSIFNTIMTESRNMQLRKLQQTSQENIAIQGIAGSFNEQAWEQYAALNNFPPLRMHYLISSQNVVSAVMEGKADQGIVALYNNQGGLVDETIGALQDDCCNIIDSINLPIRHNLLTVESTNQDQITKIYSHSQAFKQCKNYLAEYYPKAVLVEYEDTAKAAQDLASAILPRENAAVIASQRCAELYKLKIMSADIQDRNDNTTTFIIIEAKSGDEYGK